MIQQNLHVIGVVEDFYLSGVWRRLEPAMLRLIPSEQILAYLAVRAEPEDLPGVLEYISIKWKNHGAKFSFRRKTSGRSYAGRERYKQKHHESKYLSCYCCNYLSLIGMYNLVSLDIIRRTKEMGIQKDTGSSGSCY